MHAPAMGLIQSPPPLNLNLPLNLSKGRGCRGRGNKAFRRQKRPLVGLSSPGASAGKRADVFQVYQDNIGLLTPMIAEALQDAEKSDGPEWICAAIDEAVKNNARSWKYVQAILERWRRDGFQVDTRLDKTSSRSRRGGGISDDQIQKWVVSGPEEHTK